MPHPDHEQNRRLWDELVGIHYSHHDYHVKEFLEGGVSLRSIERESLGDVSGRSLLHLFCQFGLDTLSWARLGADATGVDISGCSIELAVKLARKVGLDARFVQADVLDLIGRIERQFDVVIQTYGTHKWISDLDRWAEVVAHYLKPGGTFLMVDIHPVATSYYEDVPYFSEGARRFTVVDYADREYESKEEAVEWQHTLGSLVSALTRAGMVIDRLDEYAKIHYRYRPDWIERDGYWYPPDGPSPCPLLFSLKAHK